MAGPKEKKKLKPRTKLMAREFKKGLKSVLPWPLPLAKEARKIAEKIVGKSKKIKKKKP